MSLSRRILFGAAASWFSRGVTILLGLVLMPVLFRTLPKEELGLWLLIGQSWATLGILDFGFGVTLTRRIAFAKARSGTDPSSPLNSGSLDELADLAATGVRLYRILSLVSFAVPLVLGFFYLRSLALESIALPEVWLAWALLCLSQALMVWATPWTCLLQGVGHVGWDSLIGTFVNALALVAQIVVALCGGGLVALATVAAAGALAQRVAILGFAKRKRPELFSLRGRWRGELVKSMTPLAWRAWLTGVGATLILYTDQFLIASLEGAAEIPPYRAAWVLVHNVTIVAVTFSTASGVFISHLWQGGDPERIEAMLERNLRFAWIVSLAAACLLLFEGPGIFALWLGPGNFVGYAILIVFLISETLEAQSYTISAASRATGDEGFAWSSLAAGFLKLGLSLFLAFRFGLLGIALGTLLALLATNHWYMPWRGLAHLRYPRAKFLARTLLPVFAWGLGLAGSLALFAYALPESIPDGIRLAIASLTTFLAFAAALWSLVLTPHERRRLLSFAKLRGAGIGAG